MESAPITAQEDALTVQDVLQIIRGANLFEHETFDGNDRTCATCHVGQDGFALSIERVQAEWALDPSAPLFRAPDSDSLDGASYDMLREDGLVRVHVTLAPNVRVLDPVDGVNVQIRPDGRYIVAMRRATPSSVNSALTQHLMWDGREGASLSHQAGSAISEHAGGRAPTQDEADAIAVFQRTLFSSPQLARYAYTGIDPTLPRGRTASERRGRAFFESGPLSGSAGTHGLCATCHSGPMLNRTNAFNPGDPPDLAFSGNRTSEFNSAGLPTHTYEITAAADIVNDNPLVGPPGVVLWPAGTVFHTTTPDPGALVVDTDPSDGDDDPSNPCISVTACFVVPGTAIVFHRIPTLWGIRHTAPYFHDNSAATLEDAAAHYVDFFGPTRASMLAQADAMEAIGQIEIAAALRDQAAALVITEQDVLDIAAFMRLL
jgi:cytochrome c peroxidase